MRRAQNSSFKADAFGAALTPRKVPRTMTRRIFIGVFFAVLSGIAGYYSLLLGSIFISETGSNFIGGIISIPGFLYIVPGIPFVLIAYLPMYLVFPNGGASGVFGSVLLFALIFWSLLLGTLSARQLWPFNNLQGAQARTRKNAA